MPFRFVINEPKTRKSFQKDIEAPGLLGQKIGDKFSGDLIGLGGFSLQITGGSDKEGFPMRKDLEGVGRKRVLLSSGPGFYPKLTGQRRRRSVRGNTISNQISQINLKITVHGSKSVEELLGVKPKEEKKELSEEEKRKQKQEDAAKLSEQMTDKPKMASKAVE